MAGADRPPHRDAGRASPSPWGIRQKQTGADRSRSAARSPPTSTAAAEAPADHRRRRVVHPDGRRRQLRTCSRSENRELFRLAIGGYGLFGVITHVRLRLTPRTKLERVVE